MDTTTRPSAAELLERDFLEQRARLLEVAAFLDRLDRSPAPESAGDDLRYRAIFRMLKVIGSRRGNRAEEILRMLSEPEGEPLPDRISPGKAVGAWRETP